jgi:cell wall-associated NlpC family hydrolase
MFHFLVSVRLSPTLVLVLLLVGLVAGCSSARSTSEDRASTSQPTAATDVEAKLRSAADRWHGVPHEWGGSSQKGVDCSGLVKSVFEEEFGKSLPRSTEDQVDVGQRIRRSALQPGDLVFFRHERKKYHVGIYLANGKFLHASSSSGVTLSPLDRSYWNERWWQGRRVLPVSADASRPSSSPSRPADSSSVGW